MAYNLMPRPPRHGAYSGSLLDDLQKLEGAAGTCFEGLNFLRRKATMIAIYIAAKFASGATAEVYLGSDGWRLSPDCREATREDLTQTPQEVTTTHSTPNLIQLIERSYARDYDSQLARLALRKRRVEADEKYFIDEDDDSEVSPELEAFRERSRFQLIGV